jgi:hypothetical protein
MAKGKIDGVIQAVRYNPNGQIDWVRAYLRRGPTFSDRVIISRDTLLAYLKSGKKIFIGERQPQMASTFEIRAPLRLVEKDDREFLVAGVLEAERDRLEGVPVL